MGTGLHMLLRSCLLQILSVQLCPKGKISGAVVSWQTMGSVGGLRERKKLATRQALHQAAMELAMEQGLDRLTVEAIADAATVSRRTFSNYFASKEEALLYGDRNWTQRLLDMVRNRPASELPWRALTAAADELFRSTTQGADPEWVTHARFIRSHPSLLSELVATYASFERELAGEVGNRLPAGQGSQATARLIAGCFLTAVRVATQEWLDRPAGTSLAAIAEDVLAEAGAQFP